MSTTPRTNTGEFFSADQAAAHAAAWCKLHPSWIRICDLPPNYTDNFYQQWEELSEGQRRRWGTRSMYNEFARKRRKVKEGFISGKGEFFDGVLDVPLFHNVMMVFRVGVAKATELRAAKARGDDQWT
ncbi:hypothetical protein [Burkholderia anthina]|uniref:hypothetical protein n=1 Tax=Burkholderia anthina TaxID=179879 RepID=UPI001AA0952D|nr:hypothetical protein [Burkholderia anthina]QTD91789.1 hypothetical protein J4G50_26420 [Burkholderia anthina]